MLRLNPLTKRWICRSLFLLLGVMPLLGSIAFATWHRVSHTEVRAEQKLTAMVGLDTRIETLSTPAPQTILTARVSLLDPETGIPLVKADGVQFQSTPSGNRMQFDSLRISGERMRAIVGLLQDRILKQRHALDRPIYQMADRVTLVTDAGEVDLCELSIEAKQQQNERVANISFKQSRDAVESVRIKVTRTQATSESAAIRTAVRIETGTTPLPCSLLLANSRLADRWGPDLTFQGVAWIDESQGIYTGDITGNLANVEVDRALGSRFVGCIHGSAAVQIEQAVFQSNRLEQLRARIMLEDSSIDAALLRSFATHLGVRLAPSLSEQLNSPTAKPVTFDRSEFRFQLNQNGLEFVGLTPLTDRPAAKKQTRLLLVAEGTGLAAHPRQQPQPAVNLLRALAGGDADAFPLENPACVQLWQWLPIAN